MWLGIIVAILMGCVLGGFNGFLVAILKIPAIIVTLGTMNAFRGLAFIVCGGKQIDGHQMPAELKTLVQNGISFGDFTIPWLVWIAILILGIFAFVMKYTRFGREIYAVGSNSQAAFLRGINVTKTVFLVYVITGACTGLAAIMYACRYGYVNPSNTGNGFEFVVISATIIGGTSINGGSGTVIGTFLGSVLLGSINTMLATVGVAGTFQQASYGFIIIMALLIDTLVAKGTGQAACHAPWAAEYAGPFEDIETLRGAKTMAKNSPKIENKTGLIAITRQREFFTFVLLLAVLAVSLFGSKNFADIDYILKATSRYMEYAVIALIMTFIIIAGQIDLSVASCMACVATFTALMFHAGAAHGVGHCARPCLRLLPGAHQRRAGGLRGPPAAHRHHRHHGAVSGHVRRYSSAIKALSKFPTWFNSIEKLPVLKIGTTLIPITLIFFIVLAVGFYLLLHRTGLGRKIYSLGTNKTAAIYSGVNTKKIILLLFGFSSFFAGLAGIMTMSRLMVVRFDMAQGGELEIITMVLLGGTDINGGKGSIIGDIYRRVHCHHIKNGANGGKHKSAGPDVHHGRAAAAFHHHPQRRPHPQREDAAEIFYHRKRFMVRHKSNI